MNKTCITPLTTDPFFRSVGLMLREIGKCISLSIDEKFLHEYYKAMPRTTLQYAIERFSPEKRKMYLQKP